MTAIKQICIHVFVFGFIAVSFGQDIEQTASKFWEAVDNGNDSVIVAMGEKMIDFAEKNSFRMDSTLASVRYYIGLSYQNIGDSQKALELNLESFSAFEKKWGEQSTFTILMLGNIATNYMSLGNLESSLEYNLKILTIQEKTFGKEHLFYANDLKIIAQNYFALNEYDKAIGYYLKAIEVYKKHDLEDPDYFSCLNKIVSAFSAKGDYNKVIEYNLKVLEFQEKILGKEHPYYASSLNRMAWYYFEIEDFNKAVENCEKAVEIYKELNKDSLDYAHCLDDLAFHYSNLGDLNKANENYSIVLPLYANLLGEHSPEYSQVLNQMAFNFSRLRNHKKSLECNLVALEIIRETQGESENFAMRLYFISIDYSQIGDFKKALGYALHSKEINEKLQGKDYPRYSIELNNIAYCYSNLGNHEKAIEYNLKCLEIREKTLGAEHLDFSASLNNLALNYSDLGDYNKALECQLKALKITEKTVGKNHPDYAVYLSNIAMTYNGLGEYNKALECNLKALDIREKTLGMEHPDYAVGLGNMASIYSNIGEYDRALEYNQKAIQLTEKTLGKEHPDYAIRLSNLASDYASQGDFSKALEYDLQALVIKEKILGKVHPDCAISLNNLAVSFSNLGEYNKALECIFRAIEIREKTLGKEHPDYSVSLNNLASLYSNLGDHNKAIKYGLVALEIRAKTLGKEHPDYALLLNNLGVYYSDLGDYHKALEYNLEALEIRDKKLGTEHSDYAGSINNLATVYSLLGEYDKSIKYNLEAIEIKAKTIGKAHPEYALCLNNLALNYSILGDYNKALKLKLNAHKIHEKSYLNIKAGLNPKLLTTYKKNLESSYQFLASMACIDSSEMNTLNKSWINLNGAIQADQTMLQSHLRKSQDTALLVLLEELKLNKLQMARYNEKTLQEKEKNGIDESDVIERINELETELSKRSQYFANFNRVFELADLVSKLKDDEVFVDLVRFPYFSHYTGEWTDSVKYLVFITDSKDTLVEHLFIHNGAELENEIFANYQTYATQIQNDASQKDEFSYQYFWKAIAHKVGDAKTVYISLSGIYNNINLHTLYNPETEQYLIEEKDIRVVNSARDFILLKERENKTYSSNTIALFGYPNYEGSSTTTVAPKDHLSSTRDLDPIWIDSLTRGGQKASLLPGTKVEVENIGARFKKEDWQVSSFLNNEASEENIKLLKSPRVLHIATHGYFFDDIPHDQSNERYMGMNRSKAIQNPLLRSGLLFAGANQTLQGEKTAGENGLLSAYEAALLDLSESELVVLSACETGRGEIKNSEGVYGLRKAIADAGSANIIMSLWKVDDKVTQEFMIFFYSKWLAGKSIRQAFNDTQLTIKAKYPQPYYWGAFVLIGE